MHCSVCSLSTVGSPAQAQPGVRYVAHLANILRPKVKYAAIIGSYGWSSKAIEQTAGLIPDLKVEVRGAILQKGLPDADTFAQLDDLAAAVAEAHRKDENVQKTGLYETK
ncbi:MAG: hypothetical protein PWQ29_1427 [Verrucomicrobiota bacterium]|nr:hypothetical protein [Verrucomicrobiota bacterium]